MRNCVRYSLHVIKMEDRIYNRFGTKSDSVKPIVNGTAFYDNLINFYQLFN